MSYNNKKAQGMSVNVIIIAALALVVLIVLFAIFTGRISLFSGGVRGAEQNTYTCVCNNPVDLKDQICAQSQPSGYNIKNPSSAQCNSGWVDCLPPLNCYEK